MTSRNAFVMNLTDVGNKSLDVAGLRWRNLHPTHEGPTNAKGRCTMKQMLSIEQNSMHASLKSHVGMASSFASISLLSSASAAPTVAGYPCVPAGAAAAETCTVISKRRTMNWAGRPLGRFGSSG